MGIRPIIFIYLTHPHKHPQESLEHPLARARVAIYNPQLHLYAATLSITAQLNWLQHVMHHWYDMYIYIYVYVYIKEGRQAGFIY